MIHFAQGLSYEEIGEKIGIESAVVRERIEFLKDYGMMNFGRWNVDVEALGMTKTIKFYEYSEDSWKRIYENNLFLSYLSQVKMGRTRYLAMYTFPEKKKDKIGSEISSWYYLFPHFTLPFKVWDFSKKLEKTFEKEDNENPLPERGERIENPDLIDIYLSMYVQQEFMDINSERYTRKMEEEIGNHVSDKLIEERLKTLKEKNIIYPVNPFDFTRISYIHIFFITAYAEKFRFMKALNKLNVTTGISFAENNENIIYVHCPIDVQNDIANLMNKLDKESKMFAITLVYENRTLPYKYFLREYKK